MENLGKFKKGDAVKLHGGSYLITDLIGSGMVGEVFRAIDVQRRQRCAVKYNYGNYSSNRRLFYEKLLLLTQGRAPHPAFAWPYDAGDRGPNGSFLLAMPLKEDYESLAPVMRGEAGLSPAQRLALARAVVEPFAKLHEAGYLYVDYSQTNIRYRREALSLDSAPWGKPLLQRDQVLMELKTSGGLPLWMVQALSQQKLFKTSFSKYGAAYRDILLTEQKGVLQYA